MKGDERPVSVDIRQYTRVIIRKNRQYLQCRSVLGGGLVWCPSPYHAWWDEEHGGRYVAEVAKEVRGTVRIFNPITGTIRK